jgi:hypothetical protein
LLQKKGDSLKERGMSLQFFYSGRYLPHRRMVFLAVILTLILTLWPDWVYQALAAPDPKPVEIEALRTENSKTFLKPDQKTYVLEGNKKGVEGKSDTISRS